MSFPRSPNSVCLTFRDNPQCLSGRGDKDVEQISQLLPGKWEQKLDWYISDSMV